MAAKVDGSVAGRGQGKVVTAVPGDRGSHIDFRPRAGGEASGTNEHGSHCGGIVVIDTALRPRVVSDRADLIPGG